jgi:hypothetical protein
MKEPCRGADVENALDAALTSVSVSLNKLESVATDEAPAMLNISTRLVGISKSDINLPALHSLYNSP